MNEAKKETIVTAQSIASAFEAFNTNQSLALRDFQRFYTKDVYFQDPLQTVKGIDNFMRVMERFVLRARELRFDIKHATQSDNQIFLKWSMHYRPKFGIAVNVDGMSHIVLRDGLIAVHRDYWDLLDSLVNTVPLLSRTYHGVIARIT